MDAKGSMGLDRKAITRDIITYPIIDMCVDTNNETLGAQKPEAQRGNSVVNATGASEANADMEDIIDIPSSAGVDKESWSQKYGLLVSFFVTIIACCVVYLWAVKVKVNDFEESQKKIVEIYEKHTVKTNNKGQKSFIVFQQPQENHEKFEEEIKSLLELQQSYIQDNFSSFEIWAGVLTIVFLVFSFFSLQKSEQMEQQSRESLKQIKRNMHESASRLSIFDNNAFTKLSEFDTKSSGSLRTFESQYNNLISNFKDQSATALSGINAKMEEAKTATINEGKALLKSEREKAANDFVDKLNIIEQQLLSEFDTSVEGKKNEVVRALTNAQIRLEALLNEIENLQQTINSMKKNAEDSDEDDEEASITDEIED